LNGTVRENTYISYVETNNSGEVNGIVPVLNYVPRHEDVWGSGDLVPSINVGTRCK